MDPNKEEILVVVYWSDIPQFELFCYSLSRFWQGNKKIKIIISRKIHTEHNKDTTLINSTKIEKIVTDIAKFYFDGWSRKIFVNGITSWATGWHEQQVCKVLGSLETYSEDIVVFDSKDILLKNMSLDDFKDKNYYLIDRRKDSVDLNDHFSYKYWNISNKVDYVFPSNLTPWIWNREDLFLYNKQIESKENKKLENIEFFPGHYEIENYFVFNKYLIKNPKFKYVERKTELFHYCNFHDIENYNRLTSVSKASYLTNWPEDLKILKIHRKFYKNEDFKKYVSVVLKHFDFPRDLIDRWKHQFGDYIDNWKSHDDLEFRYYKDRDKY